MYLDIRNQMQTVAESRVIIPFANIYRTEYSHFLFGRYQKYKPAQDIFSYWDFILSFYCLPDCGHCPTLMHQLIVVEFKTAYVAYKPEILLAYICEGM